MKKRFSFKPIFITGLLSLFSLIYLSPIFIVFFNSLKKKAYINRYPFQLPDRTSFVGFKNYWEGIEKTDFVPSIFNSTIITIGSVLVLLFCTSMCAWYISRRVNFRTKGLYYLFIFSMVVPFQMVMFPLSKIADLLRLNHPIGLIVIYLGFGAGLAVFLFCGFVKGIPLGIEEAATIDGAGPIAVFFKVILPILKPTYISVGILETMWIWNDYLLPYLTLDLKQYKTIPIAIQYLRGGYGSIDWGAMMAMLVLAMIPVIIFYLFCQRYIIQGVVSGAIKG